MSDIYLIGLDFGSESARGVLLDAESGRVVETLTHAYAHGVMSEALPDGQPLPHAWALQNAPDYIEAAVAILGGLGHRRRVSSIGIGFTASSPLPCLADGTPLSTLYPGNRHAYVKLWKHQSAQPWADRLNAAGGDYLAHCGGRLSGEWLLAKAAQLADEAPDLWAQSERFIEAGDWLVWQLTGNELRSESFATYKAQYARERGYPVNVVPGLNAKIRTPVPIGSSAGRLSPEWSVITGIEGNPAIGVAVIDSHVAMPALGVVESGSLMGVLGTSAVFLFLDPTEQPLPAGIEGTAFGAAIPGKWCHEAGQASFGDLLAWFARSFPHSDNPDQTFAYYNDAASRYAPGQCRLVALDWWNGCRVPFGDSALSGLLVGLNMRSTPTDIYRALLESICFGARRIVERITSNAPELGEIVMTGGLSEKNEVLMQLLADILGRTLRVPLLPHPTAIGAAIHGAVAAGTVMDYVDGARRYGASTFRRYQPDTTTRAAHDEQYRRYLALSDNPVLRDVMHQLAR